MAQNYETTLLVPDLDRSVTFYEEVMNLSLTDRRGSRAEFDTGECALVLEGGLSEQTLAAYGLEKVYDGPCHGVLISLEYDTIDPVYERVKDHDNAEILIEPRTSPWDERLFLMTDPDGYVLDVAEPI